MKVYIKNMVTIRCVMMVKSLLDELHLRYASVELGEVHMALPKGRKLQQLKAGLLEIGLELIEDHRAALIEKIRLIVVEMVHYTDELPHTNFSDYLSKKLDMDYNYLSHLFTEVKGITLEHFVILHKIERVKELIIYDEMNLKEIALKLHYSSSGHLSNQFKKVTGVTPSFFKRLRKRKRTPLDKI